LAGNEKGEIEKKNINVGDFFNVQPPRKHRIIALTDIVLQEVSTPEVDDVIRIEDDTNRKNGKLEEEQKTPAVLILAAGLGTRVRQLAQNKNKTLIPINNKAIISYIIEKYPKEYEIVIAVGYQKESLKEYCFIAYPDRKFIFVDVDGWDDPKVGPGSSALQCKQYLQRPFYLQVSDTIIDVPLPHLDGNWVGIAPTSFPEKYSTIKVDEHFSVISFVNKSSEGYDNAYMGISAIRDYNTFWSELEEANKKDSELVSAWFRPEKWFNLKAKELPWFDTGNLDDIQKAKEHFKDTPLSLYKNIDDTTYKVSNKFLKFSSNKKINENRYQRGIVLGNLIPSNIGKTDNFIYYDWEEGKTLYEYNCLDFYVNFLSFFEKVITKSCKRSNNGLIGPFYIEKTEQRKNSFLEKYGKNYYTTEYIINNIKYPSLEYLTNKINYIDFLEHPFYSLFHGDLQFDNIIYNPKNYKYSYIDWRESFAEQTECGDLYYDLAKMYGGCILPYNLLKNNNHVIISEGVSVVDYNYNIPQPLIDFQNKYEEWILKNGYNLNKIKLIKSLIYLNMSPLHTDKFNKLLWFKAIEGLYEYANKQRY